MLDQARKDALVDAIHARERRGVLAVTGGGSGMLAALLAVPGGSATVLEAHIPYASNALRQFLGAEPSQACSVETARALAMRCFLRSRELGGDFGFAITASLATDRPKRGAHRAHWAFQDKAMARSWTCSGEDAADGHCADARLHPAAEFGRTARSEEERLVENLGLETLAFSLGIADEPDLAGETATIGRYADVVLGSCSHIAEQSFQAILPGAFNPLHDGHRQMREHAARRLGAEVGYELCVANVDKPPLGYFEVQARLRQFAPREVVVTNAPTFVAKAKALGGVTFLVGADTLARIAEPRYYGSTAARDAAFEEMGALGCNFLVYGRVDAYGTFKTAADLALPPMLAALCMVVPEDEFRSDLSSTALRDAARRD